MSLLMFSLLLLLCYPYSGGLMPGDIVTHINRKQVKTSSDVYDALSQSAKTLNLTILRGDKELNITVVPEDPDDYQDLLQ